MPFLNFSIFLKIGKKLLLFLSRNAHQLFRMVEFIHAAFDNSEYVVSLFIDVAKAFVTVWLSGRI